MTRLMRDVLLPVAVALALAFVVQATIAKPYEIPTASMSPTIGENDRILANRWIYRVRDIERGDVIVFHPTKAALRACRQIADVPFVKRVVGLPGDEVVVGGGRTLVNGEPFVVEHAARPTYEMRVPRVPDDALLVLGDNRNMSCDSHQWGRGPGRFVPRDRVIGQAELVYWPLASFVFID